jgi:serine/threonine protein phosphatase PrpC
MSNVVVSISARTDIGRQRTGNEDSFLVANLSAGEGPLDSGETQHEVGERGSLLIVSDGMGGAAHGEIASELAVTSVHDSLAGLPLDLEVSDRLILAAQNANAKIWNHAKENPETHGMGATLTAVLVHDALAFIAQVGDSRAYLIRGDEIKQLTKDQSLAQLLIEAGMVDAEGAARVPQNVIMQALGTQPEVRVTVISVELSSEDGLLLCSDGLSNKVAEKEMLEIVREASDLETACSRLVEMANERGGEDNITVIIARFNGGALTEGASISGSVKAVNEDFFSEEAMSAIGQIPTSSASAPRSQDQPTVAIGAVGAAETGPTDYEAVVDLEASLAAPPFETQQTLVTSKQVRPMRYDMILILALISFLLLAAATYVVYVYWVRAPAEATPVESIT